MQSYLIEVNVNFNFTFNNNFFKNEGKNEFVKKEIFLRVIDILSCMLDIL